MQAPSAFNSQPWEFIVVSDKKDLKAVSKMSRYARPAENAQKLIIVLPNLPIIFFFCVSFAFIIIFVTIYTPIRL